MEQQLWYILNNVMNLPKRRFLCFQPEFSYDLLRAEFRLSYVLVWLEFNHRRRENEKISIVGLNVKQSISEDELISFPYFQRRLQAREDSSEDETAYLIRLINSTPTVIQALLDEYSPQLSVDLGQRSVIADRISGVDYVPAFLTKFPESGIFTDAFRAELSKHAADFVVPAY